MTDNLKSFISQELESCIYDQSTLTFANGKSHVLFSNYGRHKLITKFFKNNDEYHKELLVVKVSGRSGIGIISPILDHGSLYNSGDIFFITKINEGFVPLCKLLEIGTSNIDYSALGESLLQFHNIDIPGLDRFDLPKELRRLQNELRVVIKKQYYGLLKRIQNVEDPYFKKLIGSKYRKNEDFISRFTKNLKTVDQIETVASTELKVCHGDFWNANILCEPKELNRFIFIDFEYMCLAHPIMDIIRFKRRGLAHKKYYSIGGINYENSDYMQFLTGYFGKIEEIPVDNSDLEFLCDLYYNLRTISFYQNLNWQQIKNNRKQYVTLNSKFMRQIMVFNNLIEMRIP